MDDFILIVGIIYILIALFTWKGLALPANPGICDSLQTGSVIICARDEEEDLSACLESVEKQTLEPDRLEVILVDDASQDRTGEIMEDYRSRSRFTVQVLHLPPPEAGELSGKWRPLKEGIKLSRNEGLLLTDADAILPPTWAEKHLVELSRKEVSAGYALVEGDDLWSRIQHLDWQFMLGAGSALANWGIPQAALGKNLCLRRSTYDAVGGLEGIGFSLTEDRAILQAVVKNGGKVAFPLSAEMAVAAASEPTWGHYIQQRKRWASGVDKLGLPGKLCILTMAARNFGLVITILAGVSVAWWIWCASAAANFLILQRTTSGLGVRHRLRAFVFWELFYTWTPPLQLLHMLSNRRVLWKGRKF